MNLEGVDVFSSEPMSLSDILSFVNSVEISGKDLGVPIRVSVLRNFTVEGIEPFFKYHCLKCGLNPKIDFGNYDQVRQDIFDENSHLNSSSPDIVLIALYLETYVADSWRTGWSATEVMAGLSALYSDVARVTDAVVAVNTFIVPFHSNFGIVSISDFPSRLHETHLLNTLVRRFVAENSSKFVLVDWERIVRLLGQADCMDYRFWYMSKAPFKQRFLDAYSLELVKIARALKGKSKKCLILDCDNTLWGGTVGEDGLAGIKLDRHSYPGNVFYEFQNSVLDLHNRGILICLCSKNNEHDVWEVLDKHPYCVLKREHLTAWRINWMDKASNIGSLADELNLGLDSFVFVDDSPMECELIRDRHPAVKVLQVPKERHLLPLLLDADGLFDTLSLSKEDSLRSRLYRDETFRKKELARYENLDQFLFSLSISIAVHYVHVAEVPRVAQLTQKTNQFNLTTRRYSESQILRLVNDPKWAVMSLSVRDKFGDSGLTGVLVASREGNTAVIDTLLLSCRILGRNIEIAFALRAIDIIGRAWPVNTWKAEYIRTQKNPQVANFWATLGFTVVDSNNEQTSYILANHQTLHAMMPYISIEPE